MKTIHKSPSSGFRTISRGISIRSMERRTAVWGVLFLLLGHSAITAQILYNHPELDWRTIETGHFYVHFHQGTDRTASLVAKIGEEIYEPVTSLYEYRPDGKVHFIIRDHEDDSNGAAYYYDNKVEIMAPAMDFALRGTHNWLRNVVTHEFSHMISLGAARKMPRQLPAVYFQWLDYEKEKRPDVLQGYPTKLVSFPLAGTVIPIWFAEGMAQFHRKGLGYDTWDTHRDMLLRTAILDGEELSLDDMGLFGKNSIGNERVYNQGYGLVLYIADRFGEEAIPKLARAMKPVFRISFGAACRKALGVDEETLYSGWISWLKSGYKAGSDPIPDHQVKGRMIESRGIANTHPVFSPDGRKVAYISSGKNPYMSLSSLYVMDVEKGRRKRIKTGVSTQPAFTHDGRLVYAKKTRTSSGSHFYDLYVYDMDKRKEKRLTRTLRARDPACSPDGRVVFVVEADGTANLVTLDLKEINRPLSSGSGALKQVTSFSQGEQIFTPEWLDGERIVFSLAVEKEGRDIAAIDTDGGDFEILLGTDADERDPFPVYGKGRLCFSSDETGIFNIYSLDVETGKKELLTNVTGGAFMPSLNGEGALVYSLFQSGGYGLALIDSSVPVDEGLASYTSPYRKIREDAKTVQWEIADYDDEQVPAFQSSPYKPIFAPLSFLPRIMMDYPQMLKIGTYFYGSDFLDRVSLLGGGAVNPVWDTDAFGIFEFRRLYPALFCEIYYQGRHSEQEGTKYRFDLMEVDAGGDWRLGDEHLLRTAFVYSRYSGSMNFIEQGQKIKFGYTYHIGSSFQLRWTHESVLPSLEMDIAPRGGRRITFQYDRASHRFLDGFEIHQTYGTLVETYRKYNYDQIHMDWREYMRMPWGHSLAFRFRAGVIDEPVDSFYYFFAGGMDGMKGYPYYSLEGRKLLHLGIAYRFPVFVKGGIRLFFLYLDKLYLSVYGDTGNAWDRGGVDFPSWKKDVGIQARMKVISFYTYPMSFFADAAYGLDRFENHGQTYGNEWRFYFGILFDFLD